MSIIFTNEHAAKHREMANKIKEALQRGDNNAKGAATLKEKEAHSAYNSTLPEGITPEIVERLSQHNQSFTKANHVAVAELAADIFKQDSGVEKVVAQVGYFGEKSSLITSVERTHEYPNIKAGEGEPSKIVKHLVMSCDEDVRGNGLKTLKDAMSAEFKDSFLK